jgi:hypothetical protein
MTDRIKGFWVSLDHDIRTDDIEPIINAVECIKHVAGVEASVVTGEDWMARDRVRHEIYMSLITAVKEIVIEGKTRGGT